MAFLIPYAVSAGVGILASSAANYISPATKKKGEEESPTKQEKMKAKLKRNKEIQAAKDIMDLERRAYIAEEEKKNVLLNKQLEIERAVLAEKVRSQSQEPRRSTRDEVRREATPEVQRKVDQDNDNQKAIMNQLMFMITQQSIKSKQDQDKMNKMMLMMEQEKIKKIKKKKLKASKKKFNSKKSVPRQNVSQARLYRKPYGYGDISASNISCKEESKMQKKKIKKDMMREKMMDKMMKMMEKKMNLKSVGKQTEPYYSRCSSMFGDSSFPSSSSIYSSSKYSREY